VAEIGKISSSEYAIDRRLSRFTWMPSEKDALDVYYHGQDRKDNMRCRTYNGYELCIYYGQNHRTGQPFISTI